jgi:quinol-cytochrome oxidoreductase complex cytochrome b subunit
MRETIFQVMGRFTLVLVVLLFSGGIFMMMHYPARSPLDLVPFGALIVALSLAGLSLLYLRKWAALMISSMALYIAIFWELKDALHPIPGCANWLGFVFALLLTALTAVCWRTLTWRGDHRLLTGSEMGKKPGL